jgi:predicted transcriptional regulator
MKWRLLPAHPIVAPSYAKKRSALAVKMGLGRKSRKGRAA